jgi:hypothetical protein
MSRRGRRTSRRGGSVRCFGAGKSDDKDEGGEEGEDEMEDGEEEEGEGVAVFGGGDDFPPCELTGQKEVSRIEPPTPPSGRTDESLFVLTIARSGRSERSGWGGGSDADFVVGGTHEVGDEGGEEADGLAVGMGEGGGRDGDGSDVFRGERVVEEVEDEAMDGGESARLKRGDDKVMHMRLKQNHWTKTWAIPRTDSKHCPELCFRVLILVSVVATRQRKEEVRTRYWQQAICPHWSVTMLARLLALEVAPRRRKSAENPSELREWIMR